MTAPRRMVHVGIARTFMVSAGVVRIVWIRQHVRGSPQRSALRWFHSPCCIKVLKVERSGVILQALF